MRIAVFMWEILRNRRASPEGAFFRCCSPESSPAPHALAQGFARIAQALRFLRGICAAGTALALAVPQGCAPTRGSGPPPSGIEADAVLPSGNSWYVFRFSEARYLRLPSGTGAWEDVLRLPEHWEAIASPGGAFRPVQAVAGPRGHFYLVDAAQARLCLYDTAAQLLSTYPLPREASPFTPGRMDIFRGRDAAFTLVDYLAGEARQFVERQGGDGGTGWVLRNRVKLPLGTSNCVQEPGTFALACVLPDGPARFDPSLNRTGVREAGRRETRLTWDSASSGWALEAFSAETSGELLFRFQSDRRRLVAAPPPP